MKDSILGAKVLLSVKIPKSIPSGTVYRSCQYNIIRRLILLLLLSARSIIIMPPGDGEKGPDVRYTDVTKERGKLVTNEAHDYQSC